MDKEYLTYILKSLEKVSKEYQRLQELCEMPEVSIDTVLYRHLMAQLKAIEEPYLLYEELSIKLKTFESFQNENDIALKKLLEDDLKILENQIDELCCSASSVLAKSIDDVRDIFIEIKAQNDNVSKAHASFIANMYQNYAKKNRFELAIDDIIYTDEKYVRFALLSIKGVGAYQRLKNESGIHVITSPKKGEVEVYVYPKPQKGELILNPKELRIDIFHSGGPGGQNVNKVASAVRVTHLPTGIAVASQEERSQLMNKEKAFKLLKERLDKKISDDEDKKQKDYKESLTKNMDKIRFYDIEKNTLCDKRVNTAFKLEDIKEGDIDRLIDAIIINTRGTDA